MIPDRELSDAAPPAADDAADLRRFGYAEQLLREMGGFGNFAVSFSIISILTGAITLYGHGLRFGGPLVMTLGWPLVSVMTLLVALSMAELASAFPTAGALYHWSALLGGPGWGFFTAWLNTIGQFAITAGIDYGLAEFVAPMFGWPTDRAHVLPIYGAVLFSHGILNHLGVRVVAKLNGVSAFYHIAGVVLLVGLLLAIGSPRKLDFLQTEFTNQPFPYGYAFLVGLLQAQWTFTGYDASAHITEETHDPRRNAPWGIVLSVIVSGIFGFVMLVAVTLCIRSLGEAAAADNPFIFVVTTALGGPLGRAVVWMIIGAMWFCGLSSITSNSRMLFAFARDGGVPASHLVARVSQKHRSPHVAIWISVVAAFLVAVWADAYAAIVALSTVALYASYALPVVLGARARRRGTWRERGPWNLGRAALPINVAAIVWVCFITVLFVLPPNELAGYTFAGCLAALTIYWLGHARRTFRGPSVRLESR